MYNQSLEIYRLRSRSRSAGLDHRRHHVFLGLLTLMALALCATAIYASLGILDPEKKTRQAESEREPLIIAIRVPRGQAGDDLDVVMPQTLAPGQEPRLDLPAERAGAPGPGAAERGWLEATVRKGDSLSTIFSRLDLPAKLLHRIVNDTADGKSLARIRPGQTLRVRQDAAGGFRELIYQRSLTESLQITHQGGALNSRLVSRTPQTRTAEVTGIIDSSLYANAKQAGLPDNVIMQLATIFGWDIDFALEIQKGDSFSVIFEERWLDGQKVGTGAVLAAEFINRGQAFRAIRFENDQGSAQYFTPEGQSMRKAFLRAPVDFRRISSRFSKERFHPVLGRKRPHQGVDYAASTGTPIKAAGDGRVVFRGRKGGYGNTVILEHASGRYSTLYAHMSKFHKSAASGSRVSQGDIIGYVGATGLATGPHLHYEFRVNGEHQDPLTVDLPKALPIDDEYRQDFLTRSRPLVAQLESITAGTRLASAPD